MNEKEKGGITRPEEQHKNSTNNCNSTNEEINFSYNPTRQRIYELFLSGKHYSVVQLSVMLRIPDIRSHIRYIRQSGVTISDYWVQTEFSRYKIYFLSDSGKVQ